MRASRDPATSIPSLYSRSFGEKSKEFGSNWLLRSYHIRHCVVLRGAEQLWDSRDPTVAVTMDLTRVSVETQYGSK